MERRLLTGSYITCPIIYFFQYFTFGVINFHCFFLFCSRFDGNDTLGYRLYKEVNETSRNVKARKNVFSDTSCFCWETEATNLDEFQRVAVSFFDDFLELFSSFVNVNDVLSWQRELSSSKPSSLAAVGAMIESDAIPVVEKYHKVLFFFNC